MAIASYCLFLFSTQIALGGFCDTAYSRFARILETTKNQIAEARNAVSDALRPVPNGLRLYTGRATKKLDAESFAIFERIRKTPELDLNSLSQAEVAHLKSQGTWELLQQYQAAGRAVQTLNQKLALLYRSHPAVIKRIGLKRYAFWVRKILAPMLIPDVSKIRASRIFQKFIENPSLAMGDLSDRDMKFIKKIGLMPDLERFTQDLKDNREAFVMLSRIRSNGSILKWTVIGGAAVSATTLSEVNHKEITLDESLNPNSVDGMHIPEGTHFKDWETELILTDSKVWPVLIRIRGNFYAFTPEGRIINKVQVLGQWQDINLSYLANDPSFNTSKHTRVSLNLSIKKQRELRLYLDGLLKADIQNIPTFRNEVYRVSEVLDKVGIKVPYGINRFSEWTVDYLKLTKIFNLEGGDVIGDIRVARKEPRSPLETTKDIGADMLENLVFLQMAKALIPTSIVVDIARPEGGLAPTK